jgi:hypothetical protein
MQKHKLKAIEAPYVEGEYIFFGSRTGWVFLFIFSIALAASLFFLGAIISIILALILAFALFVAWHYFFEPEVLPGMKPRNPGFRSYKKL